VYENSKITSKTVPVYVNGKLLGQHEEVSISSNVKNGCPKDVDNVQFHVKATAECGGQKVPDVTWDYQAAPPLLHPTEIADGGRVDELPRVFQCQKLNSRRIVLAVYPPSSLWVALMADVVMLDGRKKRPVHATNYRKTKLLTSDDPCSDPPPSLDSIKQCTTNVSSDKSACLDVSTSDVFGQVEPVSGLKVPSQQVRLDYILNVQNNCPETINNVTYRIGVNGECLSPSVFYLGLGHYDQVFSADPSSVAPGDSAGVKAGQDTSINASCGAPSGTSYTSQPSDLSVVISAQGTDPTTNSEVHSQEKIFKILGGSESPTYCDQQCPQNHTSSASRRLGNASKWRARHVLLRTGIPLAAYALAGRFR
jgi:hypothetical protein